MKQKSLKHQVLLVFWCLAVPIIVITTIFFFYSLENGTRWVANSSKDNLQLFSVTVKNQMNSVEEYMLDLSLNSEIFRRLGEQTSKTQAYLDTYEISKGFRSVLTANDLVMGILVYSGQNNIYSGEYKTVYGNSTQKLTNKLELENYLTKFHVTHKLDTVNWNVQHIGQRFYMFRTVSYRSAYITAIIDLNMVFEELTAGYDLNGEVLCYTQNSELIFGDREENFIESIRWIESDYGILLNQNNNLLAVKNSVETFDLYYLVPYASATIGLDWFNLLMILFSIIVLLVIPFLLYYINRVVFIPMKGLITTMEKIGKGDFAARPNVEYKNTEFVQVNETFNRMIDQITQLKIDQYEQELEAKRIEMTALKLQIRPHFILNCLKNIYALAQTKSFQDVQKVIFLLSRYLRYILSYTEDTVTIKEEIEQCYNYVELSSVGQNQAFEIVCNYDKCLAEMLIPPIAILTLVENSVKHGRVANETLKITVAVKLLKSEDGNIANLCVLDNGNGFSEKTLQMLNSKTLNTIKKGHIGLFNVMRRLQFQYGSNVDIMFANRKGGGARIEIFIPIGALKNEQYEERA